MAIPRLDPTLTGTVDQAAVLLQRSFHELGIVRAIQSWEFAYAVAEAKVRFPSFDGEHANGAIVNWALDVMEPYAAQLLAERPFTDAPQAITTPRPFAYDAVLPWTPPTNDRDFLRADLWGTRVPGAPVIRRGSSRYPESVLTYLVHDYDAHWRGETYAAHHARQHTHFYLSWPDARDAAGFSVAQFVALAREVKSAGFWPGVLLAAKGRDQGNDIDGDPFCQTVEQWKARLQPILDALLDADVVEECSVWEWDLFNTPGDPTIEIFRWIGERAHAAGKAFWPHFSTEKGAWFRDKELRGRHGFWDDLGDTVNGLNYQADANWDPALLQGHLMDWLNQFAEQGNRHKVRAFELEGTVQYDQESVWAERLGQIAGWLACCTGGPKSGGTSARVWGSGNGNVNVYTGQPV